MLFNSINFAIFLPLVFVLYWLVLKRSLRLQNALLLISSYFFYASWDYRFLSLLITSTLLGFYPGIRIYKAKKQSAKKFWLYFSILTNLGFLWFFKYYNFFIDSFNRIIASFGFQANFWTLNIILPIGISFYTFHGLSYVLDIYRNRIKPTNNFIEYAVFISFFPLLIAGPIERATHLLPQIEEDRVFDYSQAANGLRQILWGLFKKMVIADGSAEYVNMIFNNSSSYPASTLVCGALLFAFQIYGDFSGYSDIAIGTARLFGIELLRNFAYPYFSRDIGEFWRRWHISLSTWFRDYVFYPLERYRVPVLRQPLNILIVFALTGLWHGANWAFLLWGVIHAIYLLLLNSLNRSRSQSEVVAKGKYLPSLKETMSMGITFGQIVFAWIFFRAETISQALGYLSHMFSFSLFEPPKSLPPGLLILILLFIVVEWMGREQEFAIARLEILPKPLRWLIYYILIFVIFYFAGIQQEFIYFQF